MADRSRRYAKRPEVFAAVLAVVTALALMSVLGLARLATAPL
jgi:hypothetical protein